jgi:predicted permease
MKAANFCISLLLVSLIFGCSVSVEDARGLQEFSTLFAGSLAVLGVWFIIIPIIRQWYRSRKDKQDSD